MEVVKASGHTKEKKLCWQTQKSGSLPWVRDDYTQRQTREEFETKMYSQNHEAGVRW